MLVLVSVFAQYSMYSVHIWSTYETHGHCIQSSMQQCTPNVHCVQSIVDPVYSPIYFIVQSSVQPNAHPMYMYIIYSPVYSSAHPVYIVHSLIVHASVQSNVQCTVQYTLQCTSAVSSSAIWTIWYAGLVHIWDTCGHIWCTVKYTPSVQSKSTVRCTSQCLFPTKVNVQCTEHCTAQCTPVYTQYAVQCTVHCTLQCIVHCTCHCMISTSVYDVWRSVCQCINAQ